MQLLLERQTPIGEMLRTAVLIRGELLIGIGGHHALLERTILGIAQTWLVVFPGQNDPAFHIVTYNRMALGEEGWEKAEPPGEGTGAHFFNLFEKMSSPVALVLDLTAALAPLRKELTGLLIFFCECNYVGLHCLQWRAL